MRQFFKWLNPCGNCKHYLMYHIDPIEGSKAPYDLNGVSLKVVQDLNSDCRKCLCDEWVPKDNLDRIEFLAKQRELI